jgi:hydroxypyruvate reductase
MLLRSGADIHEINCVRKHLSSIKGGRLARALVPATVLTLILSDVVGDDLDAIASGPTVPDVTTWQDAMDVIKRYRLDGNLPPAVLALLSAGCAGAVSDTVKGDDPAFSKTHNVLIGTNYQSLLAAEAKAIALGYTPLVLTSHLTGEAREAALFFLGIGLDVIANGVPVRPPACIIAGGETTVTLRGKGKGGRNQEMALAFLNGLKKLGIANEGGLRLSFLSAGTDGTDGTTDVTGAFASSEILDQAAVLALDSEAFLSNNDSYGFFSRTGGFLATGPTNTNVCDIQILVIA